MECSSVGPGPVGPVQDYDLVYLIRLKLLITKTTLNNPNPSSNRRRLPSSKSLAAAAAGARRRCRRRRRFAGICSGQSFEENPSVPISSGLLVQADEGVSHPVVDLIDGSTAAYREEPAFL
ncbi:hypothetical protein F511_09141 [Dorcoceras hygrometricum]|uniref:Uncharacterized protein n=1 Tax=Dorcoceras hygrometricum TaxID=472368 RepID=A0A2Z7AY33_9LAMI|nr:hypothetical protein F511_09141 [Dorcoceras hygrometricum]